MTGVNPVLQHARLAGNRGPTPLKAEPSDAWTLGLELADDALPRVVDELKAYRLTTLGRTVQLPLDLASPKIDVDHASVGLPLLGAVSPSTIDNATRARIESRSKRAIARRPDLLGALSELVLEEAQLWQIAASRGARSHEIPYTFRRRALEWFWEPQTHRQPHGRHAYVLCLRCGACLQRSGDRQRATEPRCASCSKEPEREWPAHAIAPAGPGSWWLTCLTVRCDETFEGSRQRQRCDSHRTARITPARRGAL